MFIFERVWMCLLARWLLSRGTKTPGGTSSQGERSGCPIYFNHSQVEGGSKAVSSVGLSDRTSTAHCSSLDYCRFRDENAEDSLPRHAPVSNSKLKRKGFMFVQQ